MKIEARRVPAEEISAMREAYRAEANCQIIYDSFLPRGHADAYLVSIDGKAAGYGALANRYYPRQIIEFHVAPEARIDALEMFRHLLAVTRATHVRAQTNIPFMTRMLFDTTKNIAAEKVLFADQAIETAGPGGATPQPRAPHIAPPEHSAFRHITEAEAQKFAQAQEVLTDWVLEISGEIVATAGYLTHYNPPYADIFMAVADAARRKGYGGYIVQEICSVARAAGKIPTARCDTAAEGSRRALERGGLVACGHLVYGEVSA
ncbi:MAG TPA: GNAT family N-acetyltransferase [Candidatus Acidoferrales bacterium]